MLFVVSNRLNVFNEKGFPVHFEIFEGNLKDSETLEGVVKKVRMRFGIEKAIFVGDRGMITLGNIKTITGEELGYIMALKHESVKDLLREKDIEPLLFDKKLPVTISKEDGKKYVLCGSECRKERDLYVFNKLLKKDLYERFGVREYWMVYPEEEKVEVYLLKGGDYKLRGVFLKHDILQASTIERLEVNLEEVFS